MAAAPLRAARRRRRWLVLAGLATLTLPPTARSEGAVPRLVCSAVAPSAAVSRPAPPRGPEGAVVARRVAAMGTLLDLEVAGRDRAAALAASERAVRAVESAEARLSTWREDAELARLGRAPAGVAVPLSAALAADLAAARRCWQATGGAFDPTVGALAEAWGLRHGGRRPSAAERRRARRETGFSRVELRARAGRCRGVADATRGLSFDAGGFGKGAALADALGALGTAPGIRRADLDFGGQVAFYGPGSRRVALADPRRRDRPAVVLTLEAGSLATSGNSERGVRVAGIPRSHLLDPVRGGLVPDFGSLSVWAADPLWADCLSTGLYVLGAQRALAWAAATPGVEVMVLEAEGDGLRARATPGLAQRAVAVPGGPAVESCTTLSQEAPAGPPAGEQTRAAVPLPQEHGPAALPDPAPSRTAQDPEGSIDDRSAIPTGRAAPGCGAAGDAMDRDAARPARVQPAVGSCSG